MYLYHAIQFKQPGSLLGAKLYIDPKFISNGKIRKGTNFKGVLVVSKEPTLSHHGIKGQKWGVRRFQDQHGNWTPRGLERRRKGNRIKGGTQLRTYSHDPFKEIRVGQYATYTSVDDRLYRDSFFDNELGQSNSTEAYRVEMTAKRDINIFSKKEAIEATIGAGLQLVETPEDYKKAYEHLKSSGYLDLLDKSIEERRAMLFGKHGDLSLWNDCKRLAKMSHNIIYNNLEAFSEMLRKMGYDAIFDPEDLLYCYDAPILIVNPDAFELGESVPIKDPDAE